MAKAKTREQSELDDLLIKLEIDRDRQDDWTRKLNALHHAHDRGEKAINDLMGEIIGASACDGTALKEVMPKLRAYAEGKSLAAPLRSYFQEALKAANLPFEDFAGMGVLAERPVDLLKDNLKQQLTKKIMKISPEGTLQRDVESLASGLVFALFMDRLNYALQAPSTEKALCEAARRKYHPHQSLSHQALDDAKLSYCIQITTLGTNPSSLQVSGQNGSVEHLDDVQNLVLKRVFNNILTSNSLPDHWPMARVEAERDVLQAALTREIHAHEHTENELLLAKETIEKLEADLRRRFPPPPNRLQR